MSGLGGGLPPTHELRARFGINLREARLRLGDVSQEELAFRAGLSRTMVSPFEQGKRMPRIDSVIRLAGAAETTPNELVTGIHWTPNEVVVVEAGGFVVPDDPDLTAEVAALREESR